MVNITADRDGQTRQFTPKQWEVMGIGKCGWSAVPEVPREVVLAHATQIDNSDADKFKITPNPPTKTRKTRRK